MHPHGLPAEDCPDWQQGYNSLAEPNCLAGLVTPEVRRTIDREYQRELERMKRHNRVSLVVQLLLTVAVVLNWASLIKRVGCF